MALTIGKLISSHLTSVNEWLKNKIKPAPCLFFLLPSARSFLSSASVLHDLKVAAAVLAIISSQDSTQKQEGQSVLLYLILSGRKPFSRSLSADLAYIMLTRIKSCARALSARDAGKTILTIASS